MYLHCHTYTGHNGRHQQDDICQSLPTSIYREVRKHHQHKLYTKQLYNVRTVGCTHCMLLHCYEVRKTSNRLATECMR